MTIVTYEISSGGGEIDTTKLVLGADGFIGTRHGSEVYPLAYQAQKAALEQHFGPLLYDAFAAMKALHDG